MKKTQFMRRLYSANKEQMKIFSEVVEEVLEKEIPIKVDDTLIAKTDEGELTAYSDTGEITKINVDEESEKLECEASVALESHRSNPRRYSMEEPTPSSVIEVGDTVSFDVMGTTMKGTIKAKGTDGVAQIDVQGGGDLQTVNLDVNLLTKLESLRSSDITDKATEEGDTKTTEETSEETVATDSTDVKVVPSTETPPAGTDAKEGDSADTHAEVKAELKEDSPATPETKLNCNVGDTCKVGDKECSVTDSNVDADGKVGVKYSDGTEDRVPMSDLVYPETKTESEDNDELAVNPNKEEQTDESLSKTFSHNFDTQINRMMSGIKVTFKKEG